MTRKIPIFAHRGASGYKFENSMDAFIRAKELGADGIEIDIQQTLDGELYVIHDTNLRRLTGVNRLIQDCKSDELEVLAIGKPFWRLLFRKRIPTFQYVVEWANANDMPLNVELKESLLLNEEPLKQMLPHLLLPPGSHISSFHDKLLQTVKAIRPEIETALIITKKFNFDTLGEYTHIDSIHANKKYYHRRLLQSCALHNKGVRFYNLKGGEPFLVSPHPSVIGWITDYPDRL
ncbi:MAG: glycerophosphodiester phosphodiesterase [Lysinibacillus sp.]